MRRRVVLVGLLLVVGALIWLPAWMEGTASRELPSVVVVEPSAPKSAVRESLQPVGGRPVAAEFGDVERLRPIPASRFAPRATTCRVTLRVVSDQGEPLLAKVAWRRLDIRGLALFGSIDAGEFVPTTDASGTWEGALSTPPDERAKHWSLTVSAPGRRTLWMQMPFLPDGELDLGVLTLGAQAQLQGRVLGQDRRPLEGATVHAGFERDAGSGASFPRKISSMLSAETQTGPAGEFRLDLDEIPAGFEVIFNVVSGEGQLLLEQRFEEPDGRHYELVLERLELLSGLVVDADDQPVEGVRVQAKSRVSRRSGLTESRVTGEDGVFQFACPRGVDVVLEAEASGWVSTAGEVWSQAPSQDTRLPMARSGGLVVRAVDAHSSAPIASFHVAICMGSRSGWSGACERAEGVDGVAEFSDLLPGSWNRGSQVYAAGYTTAQVAGVDVVEGERTEILVSLEPPLSPLELSGRVVDAGGEPVEGVRVAIQPVRSSRGSEADTRSDAEGLFQLVGLLPGDYSVAALHVDGRAIRGVRARDFDASRDLGDLRLEHVLSLTGRVMDEDGQGVAGTLLSIEPISMFATTSNWLLGVAHARSGSDGRYEFPAIPAGKYLLSAWSAPTADSGVRSIPAQEYRVRSGKPAEFDVIVRRRLAVSGQLLGTHADDWKGGRVRASRPRLGEEYNPWTHGRGGRDSMAYVSADGRFRFDNLYPAMYALTVEDAEGRELMNESVRLRAEEADTAAWTLVIP